MLFTTSLTTINNIDIFIWSDVMDYFPTAITHA